MDQNAIQKSAQELEQVAISLIEHGNSEVNSFYIQIKPLVQKAKQGFITLPLEWRDIPGGRSFLEGDLRKHRELESKFAAFRIEITGGAM